MRLLKAGDLVKTTQRWYAGSPEAHDRIDINDILVVIDLDPLVFLHIVHGSIEWQKDWLPCQDFLQIIECNEQK